LLQLQLICWSAGVCVGENQVVQGCAHDSAVLWATDWCLLAYTPYMLLLFCATLPLFTVSEPCTAGSCLYILQPANVLVVMLVMLFNVCAYRVFACKAASMLMSH